MGERRAQALRADLEAHRRVPDEETRRAHRTTRIAIDDRRRESSSTTSGTHDRVPRLRLAYVMQAPNDPKSPGQAPIDEGRILPNVEGRRRPRREGIGFEPEGHTHQAAGAIDRGQSGQGARSESWHRPTEHLRLDHRHDPPSLLLQEGLCPGPRRSPRSRWCKLLKDHYLEWYLVDYTFTAKMEDRPRRDQRTANRTASPT